MPPEFPLDWKGDMTCSTCHNVHASDPVKLRVKRQGKALCQSCHDPDFFARLFRLLEGDGRDPEAGT